MNNEGFFSSDINWKALVAVSFFAEEDFLIIFVIV